MGVDSKYQRYREAGESPNVNNVEKFGEPVRSLFTTAKILSLHDHIDITDSNEKVVYSSDSKAFSIHDITDITDADGHQVAHIERKPVSLHELHYITMADGTTFEMSSELLHLVKDITNIEGLGWQLQGNILGWNFELYDRDGSVIAVIGRKMMSIHDKYCIDIYKEQYEATVIAILVTIQHIIRRRKAAAASAGSYHSYS